MSSATAAAPISTSWKDLNSFEASTTASEKFWRGMNIVLIPSTVYSVYALATGLVLIPQLACCICIALAVRKIVSTVIGYGIYPATFLYSKADCNQTANTYIPELETKGFTVMRKSFKKGGTTYDAWMISKPDTIDNGKWSMHAFGNNMCMEEAMSDVGDYNNTLGCNTLLINGPAVGHSGGFPTRYQYGAGFEAGLQFLEKEVKATHIVCKGLSLGNGMISEMVLQHDYTEGLKRETKYLAISDRSFSSLLEMAGALVGRVVKPIFYLTGTELDGLGAAKKLSALNIQQIVIQNSSDKKGTDGVIPNSAGLAAPLRNFPNVTILESDQISHNGELDWKIQRDLGEKLEAFLNS